MLTVYHTILTFKDIKTDVVENFVKGENAVNKYTLLFSQCFLIYDTQESSFDWQFW